MNQKSKRKSLVLASLAVFSSAALASSIALMNNFNHPVNKQDQLLSPINQRSVTDNNTNSDRVKNPDEVFYTSVNLAEQDVWDDSAAGGGGTKPYKGAVDTTKKGYFDELKKKLEELEASGINSDAITQLKQISEEVDKYIKYKQLEQKWKDNNLDNTLSWEDVKEAIKGQLGNPAEEFGQINGLDTIGKYLLQLSGITSDEQQPTEKIQQLTSKTVTKKDLVTASATPFATPPTTKAGVADVAGDDYTTLVKIAEIDLTEQQNYMMEYSYASSSSAAPAKAYLIIKNDQGQVQKQESIKTAYQNLDIFGRYTNLNGSAISQGSFKEEQENIVLRKVESETTKNNRAGKEKNTLEVLVRLKQGEVISNISFSKDHGTPKRFGILDVQVDDKTTISKIIETNKAEGTGDDKLMTKPTTKATDPNTDEQLVKIQFFSSEYTSKKKPASPFADDPAAANRTIEIYQGYEEGNEDFEFSADLSYATKYSEQNSDYETIKEYVGGVATNKVVSLNLKFDGTNPSQINEGKSTYNFFALLKDNMDEEVKKLFPKVSLISANSEVKNKIAKQTIEYSDKFYLVGDVPKIGVDNSKDIKNKIPNLMDKIFAEKPKVWDETLPSKPPFRNKRDANQQTKADATKKSTLQASEQVDEKVNVIKSLATIYKKWSNNDSAFASQTFEFEKAQVLFEPNGSSFKNISIQRNQFSGNGNALYKELTSYWDSLVDMINTVFNDQFSTNKSRYTIDSKNNTEQIIVDKFFINNFEFIPNYAKVDALIAEGIKAWNEDSSTSKGTPTFENLSQETKTKFANILAQLVQIQFDAIVKEFETNQMHPLYSEFQKVLASEDKSERTMVTEVGSLLTNSGFAGLIKYQEGAWENISSKKEETAKNQLLSLIRLLNFGQTTDDRTTLSDAILTNPIVALKFKEFNPENLVNFSDSQTLNTKLNQMRIIDGILSYFGYSFTDSYIDFINNVTPSFKLVFKYQGKPTDMNFAQVLEDIIVKLSQKGNEYRPTANESYSSYWLDNIITGTNIIRSMNWKLKQLSGALPPTPGPDAPDGGQTPGTFAAKAVKTQWQPQDVTARIYDILAQQQASPAEQAAWFSAITNGSKNFDVFASLFSGRGQTNDETIEKIFNALTKDQVIMERKNDFNEAFLTSVSQSLKYIWFILVALIGVGIMTSSALGIANRARQEKLSASHPMVKWLLFSLIALGAVVAILGLGIGIPALL